MIYDNRQDIGMHFAAWEQPDLLVKDLHDGFRSLRHADAHLRKWCDVPRAQATTLSAALQS
jgi:hypothetical protein